MTRRPELTARGRAFLLVGAAVTGAAVLYGYPDVTRVGALLVLLPLLALATVAATRPRLEVRRSPSPAQLPHGVAGRVVLELRNPARRGTSTLRGTEQRDEALGGPVELALPRVAAGHTARVSYPVTGTRRGRHRLGPLVLRRQDPFSLARAGVRAAQDEGAEVIVLPRVHPLEDQAGTRPGAMADRTIRSHPGRAAAHGEDDVATRRYRHGDELRRAHWPATARRGELMVRQEEHPDRQRAVLLLDDRAEAHSEASFEWAVSMLASAAAYLSERGHTLRLVSTATLRAGRAGSSQPLDEVLRHLALAERGGPRPGALISAAQRSESTLLVAVTGLGSGVFRPLLGTRRATGVLLTFDEAVASAAIRAGWRAHAVTASAEIPAVWQHATRAGSRLREVSR